MKLLRKFLPVIIVMLIMSMYSNVFADYTKEAELMEYLGFIPKRSDMETPIKRGEFCQYLMKINGFSEGDKDAINQNLHDVNESTKYSGAISALYERKIINGYEDNNFYPNDNIEFNQAIKMIVNSIGYSFMAEGKGYPEGYLQTASELGLMKGLKIADNSKISYSEVCRLFSNLLEMNYTYRSDMYTTYKGIFMEERLNLFKTTGIVTNDGTANIVGSKDIADNHIVIDDTEYENPNNFEGFLGKKVTAYYSKDDEDCVLVYMYEAPGNSSVNIGSDDIVNFGKGEYTYRTDKKTNTTKKAYLAKNYVLVYNGISVTDGGLYSDALMVPENGGITLTDNNGDNKYDVVFVNEYRTMVVSNFDGENNVFYDKLKNDKLDLSRYDKYIVCDDEFKEINIEDIKKENVVLMIYESVSKDFARIVCNDSIAEGTVESKDTSDDILITINGKEYKLTNELEKSNLSDVLSGGSKVKIYLNSNDEIAYFELTEEQEQKAGVLRKLYTDDAGENAYMKIFSEGKSSTLSVSNKVTIDGYRYKTADKILSKLDFSKNEAAAFILFKLNSEGEVVSIDTIEQNADSSDKQLKRMENAPVSGYSTDYYDVNNILFCYDKFGYGAFKPNVEIYIAGDANKDEQQVYTKDLLTFYNYGKFNENRFYFYTIDNKHIVADIIYMVPSDWDRVSFGKTSHALVTAVSEAINANDECGYKLNIVQGNTEKEIFLEEQAINYCSETGKYTAGSNDRKIEPGDSIWYINMNVVKTGRIRVLYCPKTEIFIPMVKNSTQIVSENRLEKVWLYKKQDGFFSLSYNMPASDINESELSVCNLNKAKIIKWNGKTYEKITAKDLLTYEEAGGECDMGILYTNYARSDSTAIIIYGK